MAKSGRIHFQVERFFILCPRTEDIGLTLKRIQDGGDIDFVAFMDGSSEFLKAVNSTFFEQVPALMSESLFSEASFKLRLNSRLFIYSVKSNEVRISEVSVTRLNDYFSDQ